MKHSRKMFLIPEEVMHIIQKRNDIQTLPLVKSMTSLNQQMNSALADQNLPAEIKIKNHDQLLNRYFNLQEQRESFVPTVKMHAAPQEPQPPRAQSPQESQPQPLSESEIIGTIPRKFRSQAEGLLLWIKKTPEAVQWDEKGQVSLEGKSVKGSSISDLINDLIRTRRGFSPTGRDEFTQALAGINTPEDFVLNENRRRLMASFKAGGRLPPSTPSTESPTLQPTPPSRPRKRPISPALQRRGLRGEKTLQWINY
jgi:hypothetical protein